MIRFLHNSVKQQHGFSLTELLVVLAIIGMASSLLLPGIQGSRESGRRLSCQSNLRQIGIALTSHEATHLTFPIGAKHSAWATAGTSWWVDILPSLEESEVYSQFDKTSIHNGHVLLNSHNGQLVDRLMLEIASCPSSPLPIFYPVGPYQLMMPSYVGVAGATSHDGFPETRVTQCCVPDNDGEISAGGVLVPNRAISSRNISDGASHTIVVGEASDFVIGSTGTLLRIDAAFPSGWTMGTTVEGVPPKYVNPYPAWNITSVRYLPNERQYNLPGIHQERGANNPLVSSHPGGVLILRADASVSFLTSDINLVTFKMLATRDDGHTSASAF